MINPLDMNFIYKILGKINKKKLTVKRIEIF